MTRSAELLQQPFGIITDVIAAHAQERGERLALTGDDGAIDYTTLDDLMERIASGLYRDGLSPGTAVAIVAGTTVRTTVLYLGILRAGCVPAPIAPSSTPAQIALMVKDCGAPLVFTDRSVDVPPVAGVRDIPLDTLDAWLPDLPDTRVQPKIAPADRFNIIYSSGTTGTPKGIVHSHAMRWAQVRGYSVAGFDDATTMIATPLYSNTTLVSLLPTLAYGGTAVIVGKFEARRFLELAARMRATHAMLVPVQYQRIMAEPSFDTFDLSAFRVKTCTSAPFSAELKADIVRRWPGLLVEMYGMTEGGGICLLFANLHPTKLHTVGCPAPGHDIRLINEKGEEVATGEIGEVVGRSPIMMAGYHGRDYVTAAAIWRDIEGNTFLRHGDLGRFDAEGFLTLLGRSKELIISGGFNIYPSDLEATLTEHPGVADAAVVGVPSATWGETPYAFYVPTGDDAPSPDQLVSWANERLGRTQRLSGAEAIAELPRSAIGKVLKRELPRRSGDAVSNSSTKAKIVWI